MKGTYMGVCHQVFDQMGSSSSYIEFVTNNAPREGYICLS